MIKSTIKEILVESDLLFISFHLFIFYESALMRMSLALELLYVKVSIWYALKMRVPGPRLSNRQDLEAKFVLAFQGIRMCAFLKPVL